MTAKPKNPTRIIGSGSGHRYELDGEKVPGVTTIIKGAVPMPALIGWAGRTVAEYVTDRLKNTPNGIIADDLIKDLRAFNDTSKYPERGLDGFSRGAIAKVLSRVMYADRDEAANKGTAVHKLAHQLGAGETVDVPEALTRHVDAYLQFLKDWRPTDAIIEGVILNRRWRYMGRFDLLATLPHVTLPDGSRFGGCTLLDIKTSRSGPYGEDALQLAGYGGAEAILVDNRDEVPMPKVESYGIIHVRHDGYSLYPYKVDEQTFRVFLYCIQVAAALDFDKSGHVAAAKGDPLNPPIFEDQTR